MGKKTPEIASSPWACVTLPEEDWATAIGNMHKNLVKIACGVRDICSRTDRQTHTNIQTDRRAHTTLLRCSRLWSNYKSDRTVWKPELWIIIARENTNSWR